MRDDLPQVRKANRTHTELEPLIPGSGLSSAPVKPAPAANASSRISSLARAPVAGWKVGLLVLGGLTAFGAVLKLSGSSTTMPVGASAPPAWYTDSEDVELYSAFEEQGTVLNVKFEPSTEDAGQPLNLHSGMWSFEGGGLKATQYGDAIGDADHVTIVPRAYLAHRYYSADDLEITASLQVADLGPDFPVPEADWQRFAEVAFRIKDLQVSVFAIPQRLVRDGRDVRTVPSEMRLLWRYLGPDGREVMGNSAQDLAELSADEIRLPKGKFTVTMRLKRQKNGDVLVEALLGKARFARKTLAGLSGKVGKVALGCRNSQCTFTELSVRGRPMPQPVRASNP